MPKQNSSSLLRRFLSITLLLTALLIQHPCTPKTVFSAYDDGVLDGETLQTNPKTREVQVTATMPDVLSPSAPILVTPENQALLNDHHFSFSWYGSTDNVGVDHYQLWLNGQLYLDNLPLSTQETSAYSLVVDSVNNLFYLSLIPPLSDGQYTWNIVAVDGAGNQTSSAIWSFTLDTQAPIFVINKVDTTAVSISAQDVTSIPSEAIEIVNQDPWLEGVGEPLSQVTLSLVVDSQVLAVYHFQVDAQGHWQINLANILPRDKVVFLQFKIIDQVGNVSVIKNVPVIYPTQQLVVAVPALIAPGTTTSTPSITLPLLTPTELKARVTRAIESLLPPGVQVVYTQALQTFAIINQRYPITNWLGLILLLTPLSSSLIWLSLKLGRPCRPATWRAVIWALGFRQRDPGGILITWPDLEPLRFSAVKVVQIQTTTTLIGGDRQQSSDNAKQQSFEKHVEVARLLTNYQGVFPAYQLEMGRYYFDAPHSAVSFPSQQQPDSWLKPTDFYRQERLKPDENGFLPPVVIPTDATDRKVNHIGQQWYRLARLRGSLVPTHLSLIGLTFILFTSSVNLLTLLVYLVQVGVRLISRSREPSMLIHQPSGQPLSGVVLQISSTDQPRPAQFIGQTDTQGLVHLSCGSRSAKLMQLIYPHHLLVNGEYQLETSCERATQFQVELIPTPESELHG